MSVACLISLFSLGCPDYHVLINCLCQVSSPATSKLKHEEGQHYTHCGPRNPCVGPHCVAYPSRERLMPLPLVSLALPNSRRKTRPRPLHRRKLLDVVSIITS